jgi:hypothetical protein
MRKSVIGFWGSLDPFKRQCALIDAPYSIILLFVPANYFMSDDFTSSFYFPSIFSHFFLKNEGGIAKKVC